MPDIKLSEKLDLTYASDREKVLRKARKDPDLLGLLNAAKKAAKRRLGRLFGKTVYLVSGKYIRDNVDDDFTNGGNGARYAWVPIDEIWIDDATHPEEYAAFMIHEWTETQAMVNKNLSYDQAHEKYGNAYEIEFRTLQKQMFPLAKTSPVSQAAAYLKMAEALEDVGYKGSSADVAYKPSF